MVSEFRCQFAKPTRCGLGQTALRLGGSRRLPDSFQAAGCQFEFSARTIQPIAKMLRKELGKL